VGVGIAEVAGRAGVPVEVVARALCGGDVPSDAAAVWAAARGVGFMDWAAPGRRAPGRPVAGRPVTVAVLVSCTDRWFFIEVLRSVRAVLEWVGARTAIYHLPDINRRTMFYDRLPLRGDIDAVLVVSLMLTDAEIDTLSRLGCPLGVLGVAVPGMVCTRIDDVAGARMVVGAGHERIALIGDDQNAPMRYVPPRDRRAGHQQALAAAGLLVDPAPRRGRRVQPGRWRPRGADPAG
jgi:LacI family transcriptional regulator, repressor for deo operon, udp, cdd, tsx, nupC, and nupG